MADEAKKAEKAEEKVEAPVKEAPKVAPKKAAEDLSKIPGKDTVGVAPKKGDFVMIRNVKHDGEFYANGSVVKLRGPMKTLFVEKGFAEEVK